MPTQPNRPSPQIRHRSRATGTKWLAFGVTFILLAAAMGGGWFVYQESKASQEFERLIRPIRASGQPLGDAWMEQQFLARTHKEGSAEWSEILFLASNFGWSSMSYLPYLGEAEPVEILNPEQAWEANERAGAFLAEARPIFDKISAADRFPRPVWQPLHFDGFITLLEPLQTSRQVVRLLNLDFDHAIMNRDLPRALQALDSMQITAEAFDWDAFMVGKLVDIALRGMHLSAIQRSLQSELWSVEQLDQLMSRIDEPCDISHDWIKAWDSERAMALSILEGNDLSELGIGVAMSSSPQVKLKLMEMYAQLQALADAPAGQLSQRAKIWESQQTVYNPLFSLLMPAAKGIAEALERGERSRRMVYTSLAIKKYQMLHGTWPADLNALQAIGLKPDDWTLPALGPLGYSVEKNEGREAAYVWGISGIHSQSADGNVWRVPSERPRAKDGEPDAISYYVTTIW